MSAASHVKRWSPDGLLVTSHVWRRRGIDAFADVSALELT
jgi:hypothetical protein